MTYLEKIPVSVDQKNIFAPSAKDTAILPDLTDLAQNTHTDSAWENAASQVKGRAVTGELRSMNEYYSS